MNQYWKLLDAIPQSDNSGSPCKMWSREREMGTLCSRSFLLVGFVKTSIYPFFLIKKGGVLEYTYKRKKASPRRFLKVAAGLGIVSHPEKSFRRPPRPRAHYPQQRQSACPCYNQGGSGRTALTGTSGLQRATSTPLFVLFLKLKNKNQQTSGRDSKWPMPVSSGSLRDPVPFSVPEA